MVTRHAVGSDLLSGDALSHGCPISADRAGLLLDQLGANALPFSFRSRVAKVCPLGHTVDACRQAAREASACGDVQPDMHRP